VNAIGAGEPAMSIAGLYNRRVVHPATADNPATHEIVQL
jgi:hypothetical protein